MPAKLAAAEWKIANICLKVASPHLLTSAGGVSPMHAQQEAQATVALDSDGSVIIAC